MNRIFILLLIGLSLSAQAPPPLQEPWVGVPEGFRRLPSGKFEIPENLGRWKRERGRVRAIVLNSLGELPPRPAAILALHGHGSSKENIFGTQPSSQTVAELLARNGYVVMATDSYFNGERRGTGPAGDLEVMAKGSDQEMSLFKLNLWLGRTLWGMMLRDEQIALDYLASRPEVDPNRIGAQGMSMGSTRAWWLGRSTTASRP
jgi:dienelactone hydrolase